MARISENDIPNLLEDWGLDSRNNLPYSGNAVQKFIKDNLRKSEEKIGYSFFNPEDATLYHFKNEESYREWVNGGDNSYILTITPISFEGKLHQIEITPISPNNKEVYFTKNAKTNIITTKIESFSKAVTDKSWETVDEYIEVTISIDAGGKGDYRQIKVLEILSSKEFSIDVKDYLASGYNRLKINAVGKDTGTIANYIYSVTLTSMYLTPSNFNYAKPFIEGKAYSLGGMNIGGDLDKTLHIKVTRGEIYTKEYEIPLGTAIYPTFAYTFDDLEFPVISKELGGPTGVYHVDIWLDAFGIKSDTLSYNIMCISAEDEYSAQLVAISDIPDLVYNHDSNTLFHYYIYNKGSNVASPTITLEAVVNNDQIWELRDELKDVDTGKAIKYERPITIESIETNIQLIATIEYGKNIQQAVYQVDNSKSYPAEQDKLQFYLNPAMRSNNLDNKDKIINAANSTTYNAEWTKMSWTEDGWVTDNPNPTEENPGRACLYIPAYSKVVVDYKPLNNITHPVTLEFAYKVANTSNYDDPIITICNDLTTPKFTGIKITPKNVLVHNKVKNSDDKLQDYNLRDEEFVHIIITIIPNYNTNYGNICQVYCNGAKVRSFEFSNISDWDIDAPLILGNNTADLYLYKFRVYGRSFDKINVKNNYLNSLDNTVDKEIKPRTDNLFKSCTDDSGNIDYNTCVNNGYNTMVIEMLGGDPLPDKLHQDKGQCNLTINIHDIPEGELDSEMESLLTGMNIINQDIEGQGTTAMTYTRWNFRWKLGSDYGKRRITAKKNVASSMHSHKMGATRLFNYLHTKCVGKNEAGGNVAVYQYPVYGFQKIKKEGTDSYEYKFIGLYTVGADKGDKKTFGYNDKTYAKSLIHMEGSDHTPKSVGFDYPWDHIKYEHEQERGINTYDAGIGAIQPDDHIVVAWELGMAGEYEMDNPSHNNDIKNLLDEELEPAYNVVYRNSPLIIGVDKTLSELNSDIENWQANISIEGDEYRWYEFWLKSNYNLCFYNQRTKQYEYTGVNMKKDLDIQDSTLFFYSTLLGRYSRPSTDASDEGKQLALSKAFSEYTLEEQNQIFISERQTRFANNWDTYWHKDDCIFNYTFILLLGLTDNFKKNTYPYKFPSLSDGGKWRWRGDDFDTLFDINNQGLASKGYSILVGEKDSSGSIYAGDNSAFYKLLRDTQKSEIKSMVNKIFSCMVNHPKSKGANTQEKLVSCIKYFFWDFAQNYFPPSAYNSDAEWTYEEPWADKSGNSWKEVNPLNQSLGGHYEAEKDWVTMRMLFCSSYFNFGAFQAAGYADTSTGQLVYDGAATSVPYKLKLAIDFNPTIIIGGSETVSYGDKVKAGTIADMPISGGANTRIYIQGLDWITDLGDLAKFTISSKNPSLTIASKRLQRLKLGDSDANLMEEHISNNSTIENITFGYCPSIELIDCQNLSTLAGTIDLTQIPRLQKALLGGTSITELKLPAGAKLDELQLPDTLNTLELKNLKFLTTEGFKYNSIANVSRLVVERCDNIDSFALLRDAYNNGTQLKYIRLVGFNYKGTSEDLDMLANIASNKNGLGEDWQYQGVNNIGAITDKPVLEGVINVDGYAYEDSIKILERTYGANLTINLTGGYYVKFEDPSFQELVADTYGDSIGVTQEQLDKVTSLRSLYKNSTIKTLNDLYKFRNISVLNINVLRDMSLLEEVNIPTTVITLGNSLTAESALKTFIISSEKIQTLPVATINIGSNLDNTRVLDYFVIPNSVITASSFMNTTNLNKLAIGDLITNIGTDTYSKIGEIYINSLKHWFEITFSNTLLTTSSTLYLGQIEAVRNPEKGNQIDYYLWDKLEGTGDYEGQGTRVKVTTEMVNEALQDESITEIKQYACKNMTQLEGELVIPSNVTALYYESFAYCVNINKIELPKTIRRFAGGSVFIDCKNAVIEDLNLPNLVEFNGGYTFANTKLKKITNLGSIKNITSNTFLNCKELVSVILPTTLVEIGSSAFAYCTNLTGHIVIPDNVSRIENQTFDNCRNLKSVTLGTKITFIGNAAFANVTAPLICKTIVPPTLNTTLVLFSPKIIYVPDESVEAYKTANNWSEFANRIFPIQKDSLPTEAENATVWTDVELTPGAIVTPEIGSTHTFTKANSDTIYSAVIDLENIDFVKIDGMINSSTNRLWCLVDENNIVTATSDVAAYYNEGLVPISANNKKMSKLIVNLDKSTYNSTYVKIGDASNYYVRFEDYAFQKLVATKYGDGYGVTQEQLDRIITLPSMYSNNTVFTLNDLYKIRNLTTISANALRKMGELTSVNIPTSVEKMERSSITNNAKLERIVISSNKITELSDFLGESELPLEYLVVPDSVINCNFGNNNKIQKLFLGSSLKSISNNKYNGSYPSDLYIKNLKQWFEMSISNMVGSTTTLYLGQIEAVRNPEKGNQIEYYNWDKLEQERIKVTLPMVNEALKEVTEIKANVCANMTRLEGKLIIPDNITSIGASAFQNCVNLKNIDWGNNIQTIGNNAFLAIYGTYAERLGKIYLPKIQTLGTGVFANVFLTEVELGEDCTSIGGLCFNRDISILICSAKTPPTIVSNSLPSKESIGIIYVPDESVETYKTWENWIAYADKITGLSEYES